MHANIAKMVPIGIKTVATTVACCETNSMMECILYNPKFATWDMLLAPSAGVGPSTSGRWLRGSWSLLEAATCSIGVSVMLDYEEENIEDIIQRADKALYVAKEMGRNKVIASWTLYNTNRSIV